MSGGEDTELGFYLAHVKQLMAALRQRLGQMEWEESVRDQPSEMCQEPGRAQAPEADTDESILQ